MLVPTATERTNARPFLGEAISSLGMAHQGGHVFSLQHPFEFHRDNITVRVSSNYRLPANATVLPMLHWDRLATTTVGNYWDDLSVFEPIRVEDEASPWSANWAFATLGPSEVSAPTGSARPMDKPAAVPLAGSLEIGRQLEAMKDLKDEWADGMQPVRQWGEGYGKAPAAAELDWLISVFATHYEAGLAQPYLYPTPVGGVQAEWSLGPNEASLEIDSVDHSAEWHCLNLRTGHSAEHTVDLNSNSAWEWLANELRQLEPRTE